MSIFIIGLVWLLCGFIGACSADLIWRQDFGVSVFTNDKTATVLTILAGPSGLIGGALFYFNNYRR